MTDSSSVVLLPSTAEVCRTLASSIRVWSGFDTHVRKSAYRKTSVFVNRKPQIQHYLKSYPHKEMKTNVCYVCVSTNQLVLKHKCT